MFAQNNYKKKFQCFVCGYVFDDKTDFCNHIIENHEEGREYIKCPDCLSPVRDMKSHYKVSHPNRMMPKNIQTTVAVWYDYKNTSDGKKKKAKKPTFKSGTFFSEKCNKSFQYRSGMEQEFFKCLERDHDIVYFDYEKIKIPYFYQGVWKIYIPDLKVTFADNVVEVWEIKPANQYLLEINQAKWNAATNFCTHLGWNFIILNEKGLDKFRAKIRKQNAK